MKTNSFRFIIPYLRSGCTLFRAYFMLYTLCFLPLIAVTFSLKGWITEKFTFEKKTAPLQKEGRLKLLFFSEGEQHRMIPPSCVDFIFCVISAFYSSGHHFCYRQKDRGQLSVFASSLKLNPILSVWKKYTQPRLYCRRL